MSIIQKNKVLVFHFILFILSGTFIWTINVLGQIGFHENAFFPFFIRSMILAGLVILSYYLNDKFSKKNALNGSILKCKPGSVGQCFGGSILGFLLIGGMWAILYLIYPFDIIRNPVSKIVPVMDIVSYSLGNTLEELLFRGFLLLASVRLFGKTGAVLFVSILFGLFHLPGFGLTKEGLSMAVTTFTMSLLFISVIYYTGSIWPAVTLHITLNLILHTLGFDGAGQGIFRIELAASDVNGLFFTLIYEIVIITLAIWIFSRGRKEI